MKLFSKGEKPFTLIIDDPLDNSFIQNPYYPEKDKDCIVLNKLIFQSVEIYDRDYDMNEEFGLNDIKTDNYC